MDIKQVRLLVQISTRRKALQQKMNALVEEERKVSEKLADDLVRDGVQSLNMGRYVVYLHSQIWAQMNGDSMRVVKALEREGLHDCLLFGTQRISAMIREMGEKDFFNKHRRLRKLVKIVPKIAARVRKA